MVKEKKTVKKKEEPEGGAKLEPVETAEERVTVVKRILTQLERKMSGDEVKATMGEYIRLVQLQKELDEEAPKEIKVTWVEPEGDKAEEQAEKTGSESEG
jgi:hypothetical protein